MLEASLHHVAMTLTQESDPVAVAIAAHDRWFCRLIDCIPRDLYRPVEEDEEFLNSKYHKHKRAPLAPDERKHIRKQKRSERYGLQSGELANGAQDDDDASGSENDENEESLEEQVRHYGRAKSFTFF